jgi:hypothetical protein
MKRKLRLPERLEERVLCAGADVDGINGVTPLDALLVIRDLNVNGAYVCNEGTNTDVTGDNRVTPIDVLEVLTVIQGQTQTPVIQVTTGKNYNGIGHIGAINQLAVVNYKGPDITIEGLLTVEIEGEWVWADRGYTWYEPTFVNNRGETFRCLGFFDGKPKQTSWLIDLSETDVWVWPCPEGPQYASGRSLTWRFQIQVKDGDTLNLSSRLDQSSQFHNANFRSTLLMEIKPNQTQTFVTEWTRVADASNH